MKRIRQGWNALRQNRRSGVSLIVALCAVAVLIGLSLSIVYSSSMILSRANRKIGRERCYQLAQSFAQTLDYELCRYNTERDQGDEEKDKISPDGTFYRLVNKIVNDSNFLTYDPDDPDGTSYYFTTGVTDGEYGKVKVILRKENSENNNENPEGDEFDYSEREAKTRDAERTTFIQHQISVSVIAELGKDSYTYTTHYYRKDGYKPQYTWSGSNSGEFPVYWLGYPAEFSRGDGGEPFYPADTDELIDVVKISYTYKTDNITYMEYVPVHDEQFRNESGGAADE